MRKKIISVVIEALGAALTLALIVLIWLSVNAYVNNRASWPEKIFELANVREVAVILAVTGLVLFGILRNGPARKMLKRMSKEFKRDTTPQPKNKKQRSSRVKN